MTKHDLPPVQPLDNMAHSLFTLRMFVEYGQERVGAVRKRPDMSDVDLELALLLDVAFAQLLTVGFMIEELDKRCPPLRKQEPFIYDFPTKKTPPQ